MGGEESEGMEVSREEGGRKSQKWSGKSLMKVLVLRVAWWV